MEFTLSSLQFGRYRKGWAPSFDIDSFFGRKPTIRDTGKGSGHRDTTSKGKKSVYDSEEPRTYEEIKSRCLDEGTLWEDPDFPADDTSIYYNNPPSAWPDIEWLRPTEICDEPQLFVDGATRMDVNQGILGDCWLLAAVASLATNDLLLHRVVPPEQNFTDDYAGIFKFQFWQYGRWVEICIDDRLPTKNGRLIYMHSDERNEFWSAMLEKAYAKLCGNYETLSGGLTSEAMTDFTGGVVERFVLRDQTPADFLNRLLKAKSKGALMGCSIDASAAEREARLDNGLIIGHAYSVTDVRLVDIETPRVSGKIPMIRVRNPWGDEHEWNGAWSDKSEEWRYIPEEQRNEMGLTFSHDGEFWMSYNDFVKEFQKFELCYLGPDSIMDDLGEEVVSELTKWEGSLHEGSWKRYVNAGGCRNYPGFHTNPQYRVHIEEADEEDEDGNQTIVVAVMQKDRRRLRKEGKDNHAIGYAIYQLDDPGCGTLSSRYFQTHKMTAKSPNFINLREVCGHHALPPGDYCIIPSTFEPNQEADFILRVFSEKQDEVQEMDDETATGESEGDDIEEDTEGDESKAEIGRSAFVEKAGHDGEVDAYELRDILNDTFTQEFEFDGFSADMCRGMVAMKDADLSGKLDYSDFQSLWKDLTLAQRVFKLLDADGSGFFSSWEFRRALNNIGLRVSNSTFNAVVMRYSDKEGHVRFDDFVACVIKLKTLFETFKEQDEENAGEAKFKLDEFVQVTMYS